jgi:DNA polymerase
VEDALEQLEALAATVSACTRCPQLAASRRRAVPGGGHPHCHVMVVTACPGPADEAGGTAAGEAALQALGEYMPALVERRDRVYVTSLVKCVARDGEALREPSTDELEACFPYLSRELTITTPHYVLSVGEACSRFLLGKLFARTPYEPGDALELRVFESPSFRVVPVATPDELAGRDARARKEYAERLHALARAMAL